MTVLTSVLDILSTCLSPVLSIIESVFFKLVRLYDDYVYSPLQRQVSPVVSAIPRHVTITGTKYTVFSANIVSYTRTLLAIPIVCLVKYDYFWSAFLLVLLHDFLDHVDGIVAKVHKQIYGPVDDPLLGGFMDAFCDKIVNVTCLWSLLLLTDYSPMTFWQSVFYMSPCAVIIAYEFILGVVRVQDYFAAFYAREYQVSRCLEESSNSLRAVMEGKLKEKLESMGIAFLCLSQASPVVMESLSGISGVFCLVLSVRLAHASLVYKLQRRRATIKKKSTRNSDAEEDDSDKADNPDVNNDKSTFPTEEKIMEKSTESNPVENTKNWLNNRLKTTTEPNYEPDEHMDQGVRPVHKDGKVDKVYTIGCFDLFHYGHVKLLQRMRSLGKQVIVGVHDNHSIQKLKNRVPIDNTEQRMNNVKKYADVVYCVAGTNPWTFLKCIINPSKNESSIYVRGDDMPNFPARSQCEKLMPIYLLPYTQGVSSTKLREKLFKMKRNRYEEDDYSLFY